MMTATIDTGAALHAAERALQGLQDEEAGGATALRQAAARGDLDAVRDRQARGAILPVLLTAAHERVLRARLAQGTTERAAAEAKLATARADAERRLELLGDQRRATTRELAALLGLAVGDDGELRDIVSDEDAA